MSFWVSEIGEVTGKESDAFAQSFKIIPGGTMALAKILHMINVNFQGYQYINIDWLLTLGDFKGQKVSQKLKVFDSDPKVRHRSLNMLRLLYQRFSLSPSHADAPSDKDLSVFLNKIAGIKIRETEPNDEGKQYNWVSEVHDSSNFICETGTKIVVNKKQAFGSGHVSSHVESAFSRYEDHQKNQEKEDLNDDIPF